MDSAELKQIAVLHGVDDAALARLADALGEKEFAHGQSIFGEGDPGDSMYFIVRGRIRIQKRAQGSGAPDKTLAVLEAGDFFGEMSLFEQKPRSASALAE